jgi:ADP-heptose:LPS heptosyltransferase
MGEPVNRITVIHMGAVGDLIQAMPLLRAVRLRWPQAPITIVGRPQRAALARLAGYADACADFDTFRRQPCDPAGLVIDFLGTAGKPGGTAGQVLVMEPLPPPEWTESTAAWLLAQAREALGLPPVPETPEIRVPDAALRTAGAALAARGIRGTFAAIHPGSGSPRKNWPLDRFVEIAHCLRQEGRRQVVWLAGPAEAERGTLAPLGRRETVLADLALEQVAGVLAAADLYVGNDSGITHLAAAVRRHDGRPTPTVALFGPTDPRAWAPRGPHVRILRSHDEMMDSIGTEGVWEEIRTLG